MLIFYNFTAQKTHEKNFPNWLRLLALHTILFLFLMILNKIVMKRLFFFLLFIGVFCACSNSEDNISSDVPGVSLKPGDSVSVYSGVKAVYEPMVVQDASEWVLQIVQDKSSTGINLFQGERMGNRLYLLNKPSDSSIGRFFNEDGEEVPVGTDYANFFSETSKWKLIFYN